MKRTLKPILWIVCVALLLTLAVGVSAVARAGDINGDGKVTVFDAQMLLEAQLGLRQLTDAQLENRGNATVQDIINTVLTDIPEATEPEVTEPALDADTIAVVQNGTEATQVKSVADMVALVAADGNTQITLYRDINTNAAIVLPYSCTMDFNGHTVRTNPTSGNGIQVSAVGSKNQAAIFKNGTLVHYEVGLRIAKGAVVVENMTIQSLNGACVAVYQNNAAYKSINRITGSTLSSANYVCFTFHNQNTDYSQTGVSIDNSVLINHKNVDGVGGQIITRRDSTATIGQVHLGENVEMYSYAASPNPSVPIPFTGKVLNKDSNLRSVQIGGVTYEGLNHWSTEIEVESVKILLIGNSFSYRMVEELYGVGKAAGQELYIANLYYAGCTVQQHWTWLQENAANYDCYVTNSAGRWKAPNMSALQAALEAEEWDIITLQQHFSPERTTTYDVALSSCTPYTKNLFDYLKKNNPTAKLYWYQTWAYSTAHSKIGTVEVQTNQYNQIKAVSDYLAAESNVPQLPCGDAWQLARVDPLVTEDPCLSDHYHDGDKTGGQYLNACVWIETFFGKSCVGNTYRPDTYSLSETLITQLQLAAHEAVADMYGENYAK